MIPNQRHLFDIPSDVAYLNCAYMSPLLTAVRDAGHAGVDRKRRPWHLKPADFFDESNRARTLFAELIHGEPDGVAIVPSVSYGMGIAAANATIKADQTIIALTDQFPANVYPWQAMAARTGARFTMVPRPDDDDWTAGVLERIDGDTALVALPHCHWTDGGVLDLVAIGRRCREVEAALVIDATQSCGALPFDVAAVQPDLFVAATYKWMLGPYSLGFAWIGPRWRNGTPIEETWIGRARSEDFARLVDYQTSYQPGAQRFDVGERSNFALLPMAVAGMTQLLAWGIEDIAETLLARTTTIAERAAPLGFRAPPADLRASHYLGLNTQRALPDDFLAQLAARNVFVSVRGSAVRVTPHLYTTDEDVDRFFDALDECLD